MIGTLRILPPLPIDGQRIGAVDRRVAPFADRAPQKCAGPRRRAATARRRRARRSRARGRLLTRRSVSVTATADAAESGRGRFFSILGVRIAAKAEAVPCPSRSRWRAKERRDASWRMSDRLCTACMRRADRNARMSSGLRARIASTPGGSPRWFGQEGEKLPQVAAIGLDGLGRQPAFLGERSRAIAWPPGAYPGAPGMARSRAVGESLLDMFPLCARPDTIAWTG